MIVIVIVDLVGTFGPHYIGFTRYTHTHYLSLYPTISLHTLPLSHY